MVVCSARDWLILSLCVNYRLDKPFDMQYNLISIDVSKQMKFKKEHLQWLMEKAVTCRVAILGNEVSRTLVIVYLKQRD